MKFKVGDRVLRIGEYPTLLHKKIGVVVSTPPRRGTIEVDFGFPVRNPLPDTIWKCDPKFIRKIEKDFLIKRSKKSENKD